MKLVAVLLEEPVRFASTAEDVWSQGGAPPRLLSDAQYDLGYEPDTQLVSVCLKSQTATKLIHASRIVWMESAASRAVAPVTTRIDAINTYKPAKPVAKEHWRVRNKRIAAEAQRAAVQQQADIDELNTKPRTVAGMLRDAAEMKP